jgi:uncharacterized repeat protein (TIGR01451 family)
MAFAVAAVLTCLLSPASSAFAQEADLLVTKSGPASAAAGTNATYTINLLNLGPDDAVNATLVDPIPPGMTYVSLSSPVGWFCTVPAVGTGGLVNCSNALFAAGSNVNFSLTVAIPAGTPGGTVFTNIASVGSPTFDPTDENNSGTAVTIVSGAPSSDVQVQKSAPATVQAGANLTYTIQAGNNGPDAAASVQLTDTLPGNLTFVSVSAPLGWSCSTPAVGAGGTITCSIATLATGAGGTFTLTANVPPATPAGTEFTNTASISTANPDPTPDNDQSTVTTTAISAGTDLTIAKTHSGNATQGQTGFAYTIAVSNAGTAPSSGTTTVQDALPPGLTATAISGAGWVCTLATASCTRSDALGTGASYPPITLTVNVAANAPNIVTNTATVTNAGDVDASNNSASDPTAVTAVTPPGPDFSITKTHSGDARPGQSGFVYTITVRNVGTGPGSGTITVTDVLPAKLTATAVTGAGWTCSLGATPTCTRSDPLAAGAAWPAISLTVSVASDAPPTVTNVATVSGGGDVNSNNDSASDQTNVKARPDPTRDPDVVGLINAQMAAAQRFANTQISNFNERLEALHDDTTGDQMGLTFGGSDPDNCMIPGTSMPRDPFDPKCSKQLGMTDAFAYAPDRKAATKAPPAPRTASRNFAFWSTGYVSFGSADPTLQRSAIDFNTSGVSGGVDYRLGRNLILGIGAGYGRDRTRIGDNGTRSAGEAFNGAVYGSYRPFANTFLDAVLGHGVLRFNSQRFVVDDNAFVYGSRGGNQTFASLTAAYQFKQGAVMLSPYLRANAAWVTLDGFTETGGLGGALTYSAQSAEFYTAVLGLRGRYTFLTEWGTFAPRFRVEYNHDFNGSSGIFLQYSDLLSPVYSLTTAPVERDRISFGVGADTLVSARHRISADYQYDVDFLGSSWHRYKLRWESKF